MATLYSNELKAVVVMDNFLDNPMNVLKENCMTVQHFNYDCVHKRNDSGEIYGAVNPVTLDFVIRVNSPRQAKVFYKEIVSNEYTNFSFLFNVTYNANQRLENFEDGMVVNGYIVHIEENYASRADQAGSNTQIEMKVKILSRSVTYLGSDNNYKSTFIQ
jgi:hypothetical protein